MTSRSKPARSLISSIAVGLCAVVVASCGGDEVPSSAVAKVGDKTISKDEFNRWLTNAAAGAAQGGSAVVPDPPEYTKCRAGLKDQQAAAPKGQAKQTDKQLTDQCKQQYDQLKGEVMQFLIQAQWVQQEAEKRDVSVSDDEVKKSFADQKKQAFPKDADYKKFLDQSGMSEQDILFRVKLDTLQTKLTKKVTAGDSKVTEAQISDYFDKNRKQFDKPESRDLDVVLAKTKARADEARAELDGGAQFASVAKEFSIDDATKSQGGKLAGLTKGQQDKDLEEAAFAARRGELSDPVETQFGFYVFRVTKVTEPSEAQLADVRGQIRQQLSSQREQKALSKFIKTFRADYKKQTQCADDFRVAECDNAPKESKSDAAPAPPGGAAPGGAPQVQPGAPGTAAPAPGGAGGAAPAPTPTPAPAPAAPAAP